MQLTSTITIWLSFRFGVDTGTSLGSILPCEAGKLQISLVIKIPFVDFLKTGTLQSVRKQEGGRVRARRSSGDETSSGGGRVRIRGPSPSGSSSPGGRSPAWHAGGVPPAPRTTSPVVAVPARPSLARPSCRRSP